MLLLGPAEPVVSVRFIHLLDYVVALKVQLLCLIDDIVIFFSEIVKLMEFAFGTSDFFKTLFKPFSLYLKKIYLVPALHFVSWQPLRTLSVSLYLVCLIY